MENPTYDEAAYMVTEKRRRARLAITKIMESYASKCIRLRLESLLDYFSNMVYAIELLMKILARQWDAGKPKPNHNVADMYKEIFGREHAQPDLMAGIKEAILDQKFLIHPKACLLDRLPDLERLWDELSVAYDKQNSWTNKVAKDGIELDLNSIRFLTDNVGKLYYVEQVSRPMDTKEARIQNLQDQIDRCQAQIEALQQSTENMADEWKRLHREGQKNYEGTIQSIEERMKARIAEGKGLSFTALSIRAGIPGVLDNG